jgi:hypothetical protein
MMPRLLQNKDDWKGSEWRTVDMNSERGRLLKEQLEAELNAKKEDKQMSEESKRTRVLDFVTVNPEGVLLSRVVGQLGSGGGYAKNKLLVQAMAEEGLLRIGDLNGREAVWLVTAPKEEAAPDESGVLRGKARVRAFDTIGQDLIEYRLHLSADNRRRDWLAINSVVDVVVSKVGVFEVQSDWKFEQAAELGRARGELEVMREELSQAREEMESVKQQRDKLLIRVDSVEHRKLESSAAMSSENEQLLRRRCDELAAKLNEARGDLERLQCQADGDVPMLRQRIVELVAEGYELGEKLGHEQAKVAELTHRHHKAAEQLARLRRQHARLLLELAAEVT